MTNYQKRIITLETMFGVEYLKEILMHINQSYDAIFRLEGGQLRSFVDHMKHEDNRTDGFSNINSLANDKLGYDAVQVLAVLVHPCQECAEDPKAWHTRVAFCDHKQNKKIINLN